MSFLIDPPWLYATGRAYRRLQSGQEAAQQERTAGALDAALAGATVASFLAVSVSLYQDRAWTRPIWRACRAESGRDWMLNSGVFKFDWRHASARTHLVSAAIFATYPMWLWLGMRKPRR